MRKISMAGLLLSVSFAFMTRAAVAADCKKCDCVHLPCPPECKNCCGIASGQIESVKNNKFKLDTGETFKLEQGASQQPLAKGQQVTIYFRNSGEHKIAERIERREEMGNAGP